jgi:mono/diheme cytochrome c family protein
LQLIQLKAVMSISWSSIALALALCTVPTWSSVRQTGSVDTAAIGRGHVLYEQHCAACHGKEGKGDGPTAATLRRAPTDLTLMRQRNGAFFTAEIESAIRGVNPVVAHGAPGMMVWGIIFRADTRGNQAAADARLRDLVAFIASIQAR